MVSFSSCWLRVSRAVRTRDARNDARSRAQAIEASGLETGAAAAAAAAAADEPAAAADERPASGFKEQLHPLPKEEVFPISIERGRPRSFLCFFSTARRPRRGLSRETRVRRPRETAARFLSL